MAINWMQIQAYLEDVDYPATKEDLINKAEDEGAPDDVIATLERIPDQTFLTPAEVNQVIGALE